MRKSPSAFAAAAATGVATLGLAACTTVTTTQTPPAAPSPPTSTSGPASTSPAPAPPASQAPASHAPASPAPVGTQPGQPGSTVTDPWAVVSAYYADIESGHFGQAWDLIGSGATTGQTYQQFVDGFACTGSQELTELGESGDQVSFALAATNSCTGAVQHFSGTDTVQNGEIVAANVRSSS